MNSSIRISPGGIGLSIFGVHLGTTRETLLTDLRRRAYFRVSAALTFDAGPT